MLDRFCLRALLSAGLLLPLASCSNPSLTSIVVSPATETSSLSSGLQTQFTAIGYYTHPNHAAKTLDVTNEVTWASANPQMVTINSSGLATVTGLVYGNTTISASAPGFNGDIVGTADFIVQKPTTTSAIVSLSITPARYVLASAGATEAFTATGSTTSGSTRAVTTETIWSSSAPDIATINASTGVATAVSAGTATITATYTNSDGTTTKVAVPFIVQ